MSKGRERGGVKRAGQGERRILEVQSELTKEMSSVVLKGLGLAASGQ